MFKFTFFSRSNLLSMLVIVALSHTAMPQMALSRQCQAVEPEVLGSAQRTSVIELWYVSPQFKPEKPEVAVLSDGSVWTVNGVQTQLTQKQLNQLLNDLLASDKLAQFSSEELSTQIQAESARYGLSCRIPNADDTMIRIRQQDEVFEVRCHAVGLLVNRFPQVNNLKHFASAQRRLENIRAVTEVGGEEAAQRLAQVARTRLEYEHGVDLPICSSNLSMVRELPDGSRYCQFLVSQSASSQESHIVSVFQSPGTTPRVTLQNSSSIVQ